MLINLIVMHSLSILCPRLTLRRNRSCPALLAKLYPTDVHFLLDIPHLSLVLHKNVP